MIDEDAAKERLHNNLRTAREAVLRKLDGLGEYDIRRPLTWTGTNLLGLVKHLSFWDARYFGEVFGRPFPEPLPRRQDNEPGGPEMWAAEDETREEITSRYRRVWAHSDATIAALALDAPGRVEWWGRPEVRLFDILVHMHGETARHAGHADILREQLDHATGRSAAVAEKQEDAAFWEAHRAKVERAAKAAAGEV
ncbi:DinB family protein [Streptomyces sp. NPDC058369]|uniref:DinB family protein n=1 Tax=unclassified Streptomyces TaxID=2593676 RepID=UPI0033A21AEB